MFDNEHFIRSRSFSGWTHTLLVSRATASPREVPPFIGPADLDVDDLGDDGFLSEKGNARQCAKACTKMKGLDGSNPPLSATQSGMLPYIMEKR
jgi:hypothetical protein